MQNLIIIGNGFDRHHNMKTSYHNYRDFLISTGKEDIVEFLEKGREFEPDWLWNDLESNIGLLEYESAYCFLLDYGSDEWRDSAHHDFQYEISTMTDYWPGLKDYLAEWIKSIPYGSPDAKLNLLINSASIFLSFNYTNTLEKLYGIPKEKITYIHGDVSQTDNLILGHCNHSYYPEWDSSDPNCDVRLKAADEIMEQHRLETIKPIDEIIQQNKDFFLQLEEIDKIFVLGLSYNETDKKYLEKISHSCPNAKWYFNCYEDSDFKAFPSYAYSLLIRNYEIIDISEPNFNAKKYI